MEYKFKAELWIWPGEAAWHFITLPKDYAEEIKKLHTGSTRGFGSLKVKAKVGETVWDTSIFPDTKSGSYLLPIKKAVRQVQQINAGDIVDVVCVLRSD